MKKARFSLLPSSFTPALRAGARGLAMKENIWGRNAVYELLRANRRQVYKLLVAEGVQERGHLNDAIQLAQQRSIPIQRVKRPALDRHRHQGILAEVRIPTSRSTTCSIWRSSAASRR
jgi:tRNA G18 (ribose-2'-O)-methylase SpoU